MTVCPIFPEVCPETFSDLSRTIFVISNCVTLIIETQTSLDRMHMTFGRARLEWAHPDRLRKSHSLLSISKFMSPWQHDWYAQCSCLSGNHSRTISPNFRLKFVEVTFLFGAGTGSLAGTIASDSCWARQTCRSGQRSCVSVLFAMTMQLVCLHNICLIRLRKLLYW